MPPGARAQASGRGEPAPTPASGVSESSGRLFELRDVEAGYGPFRAVFGVSLSIARGRVLALLGPNGSGKTTVARLCSGLVAATSGSIWFDGVDISQEEAYEFARRGVTHAPEGRSVFASLTVEENLELSLRRTRSRDEVEVAMQEAFVVFPRLRERRKQLAGTLSGGEQRMLSLARVIVYKPKLLIADELSLGLAPIVVDEVYARLKQIRDAGTALLIVEQHVGHALTLADEVVILERGVVGFRGDADSARDALGLATG